MEIFQEPKDNWIAGHLHPKRTNFKSNGQDVHFDGAAVYPSGIRYWFSWRIREIASLDDQRERIRQAGSFRTPNSQTGPHLEVTLDGTRFELPSGPGQGTEHLWILNFWFPWEVRPVPMELTLTWREQSIVAVVQLEANEVEAAMGEMIELWPPSEDTYRSITSP